MNRLTPPTSHNNTSNIHLSWTSPRTFGICSQNWCQDFQPCLKGNNSKRYWDLLRICTILCPSALRLKQTAVPPDWLYGSVGSLKTCSSSNLRLSKRLSWIWCMVSLIYHHWSKPYQFVYVFFMFFFSFHRGQKKENNKCVYISVKKNFWLSIL